MKARAFSQIIGLCTLGTLIALSAHADDTDLRPVWMSDQSVYSQNSAFLYSAQDPSFASPSLQQQMLSNSAVQDVEQQYETRSRDYDMRQAYGIATIEDEGSYVSDVNGMGKSMFTAARLTPVRQYQQNAQQSEQAGEVSQPVAIVGSAAALGSGTQMPFRLCDSTRGSWSGDLMNQHGELNVTSPVVNARVEMNMKDASQDPTQPQDPTNAAERYKVSFDREVAFQVTSSVIYGSSSNSFIASVSRPILANLSGSVGTTRPAGDNISGTPPQVTGGVSYGIKF